MSEAQIRFLSLKINHLKNVSYGAIEMNKAKNRDYFCNESDLLGIYGQNGSGKTTVIQTVLLFKILASGMSIWNDIADVIEVNSDSCSVEIAFSLDSADDEFRKYIVIYEFEISKKGYKNAEPGLTKEILSVSSYDGMDKWSHITPYFECNYSEETQSFEPKYRYDNITSGDAQKTINISVGLKLAQERHTSFLFSSELLEILKNSAEKELFYIVNSIKKYAITKVFAILNSHNGGINLDAFLPLTISYKNEDGSIAVGDIPIDLQNPMITDGKTFSLVSNVIENMNVVIKALIPGLQIEIKNYGEQLLKNGQSGIRYEIVSNRYGHTFPIRYESDGIKKIISILNVIIAMYNSSSVLIAIDELDAGIFELLLGTLLRVLEETGKGQLIFTSHNLRPLEILNKNNIIFSTTNKENRYIRLSNIKSSNNLRDCYIRALSLGGQKEDLSFNPKESEIRRALRKAGKNE